MFPNFSMLKFLFYWVYLSTSVKNFTRNPYCTNISKVVLRYKFVIYRNSVGLLLNNET